MSEDDEQMHIGHYILGKTIGCGGFARVREAKHDLTGTKVAVKILNKSKMKNKNMISKVKREIRILKFINHPNVIKLYEVLDTTSDIFVVMEMAEGGQLYNYIQNNDFTEDQALPFFRQIIQGVQAAHLHLVAHRDLKPENVLLATNNAVKIADFGLSNIMKDGKLLRTSCGSLNYAAPQIIGHRSYEGTSVDVWSCGVILYTMLVGELPFDEEVTSILYRKIEKADFQIPEFVSPLARDLLRRMITVNPCERIKVKDIKNHPWMTRTTPIYSKLISLAPTIPQLTFELDPQVLNQVRSYNMESLRSFNDEERIRKVIQRRTDDSFVIAYQLLHYQKQSRVQQQKQQQPQSLIFRAIPNKLVTKRVQADQSFKYGYIYTKPPKVIIEAALEFFRTKGIQYTVKNNEYCLICSYSPVQPCMKKKNSYRIEDLSYGTEGEQRFRRDQINFILQLYSKSKSTDIVMDLRLVQGHPLNFISFSQTLYKQVQSLLGV